MEILIPALIAALVSIFFGSVAGAIVSHVLTTWREDKEYRLKKLEELFIAVQFWCNHLKKVYFNLGEVAAGNLTWNDGLLRNLPRIEEAEKSYATALMLSNVFFKDLTFALDQITKLLEKLHDLRMQFKAVQQDGQAYPNYMTQFDQGVNKLGKLQNEFNEKLYRASEDTNRGGLITSIKRYWHS